MLGFVESPDDRFFGKQSLEKKWNRPDFAKGAEAKDAIGYLDYVGKNNFARIAEKVRDFAGGNVRFVVAHPNVAAYVVPGETTIFYNLYTLGNTDLDHHRHVVKHEQTHLNQQKDWGSFRIPGFDQLTSYPYALSLFVAKLGLAALNEDDILEGFTESVAIRRTKFDPNCAYNAFQVPLVKNDLEDLVFMITGQSLLGAFDSMNAGNKSRFRLALLETANYLVFEDVAKKTAGRRLDLNQRKNVRAIARCAFHEGRIFSPENAKDFLFRASAEVLRMQDGIGERIKKILPLQDIESQIIAEGISVDISDASEIIGTGNISDLGVQVLQQITADRVSDSLQGSRKIILSGGV